jgi:hypothetical protein
MNENYDYLQLHHDLFGLVVKGYKYDGYPSHSVLAGQTRIDYLDTFDTEEEALKAYPELAPKGETQWGSQWVDAQIKDASFLPDEPDLVF